MTVNTLILGFEVSIIILLFALCWQLSRQYRAFHQHRTTTTGYTSSEQRPDVVKVSVTLPQPDALKEQYLVEEASEAEAFAEHSKHSRAMASNMTSDERQDHSRDAKRVSVSGVSANNAWCEDQANKSNAILNDYIDGFFSDSSAVSAEQLANFKAEPKAVTSELSSSNESVDVVVDNVPVLQPILLDDSRLEDDDSFIMVEESNDSIVSGHESADVMSDKVVLAMLKEAKTACS